MLSAMSRVKVLFKVLMLVTFSSILTILLFQLSNYEETEMHCNNGHPTRGYKQEIVNTLSCNRGKRIVLGKSAAYTAWMQRSVVAMNWQIVDMDCNFYVYSAYRDSVDWKIRIIGLTKKFNGSVTLTCYLWKSRATRYPKKSYGRIRYISGGRSRYTGTITSCPIEKGQRPYAISVSLNNSKYITNIVDIKYPDKERTNITVCIPVMHSNFREANKTISLIETNRLLGAQRFVIYYYSASPEVNAILDAYVKDGIFEIVNWALPVRNVHYYGQDVVNNDCLYRNMFVSRYIIFTDLDEIMIPKNHTDLLSFIKSVESEHVNAGSMLFRNVFFCTNSDWKPDIAGLPESAEVLKYDITPLLRVIRDKQEFFWTRRSKQIVISDRVWAVRIHLIDRDMFRRGFKVHLVNSEDGLLHHYRDCRVVPNTTKDEIIRIFADKLLENVRHRHLTINSDT